MILAVAHNEFKAMQIAELNGLYGDKPDGEKILVDVKGIFNVNEVERYGIRTWRL